MIRLMPHQAVWLREHGDERRVALLWEMRLGKTIAALHWAVRHATTWARISRSPYQVAVLCPAQVKRVWEDEIEACGLNTEMFRVVSYEYLTRHPELLDEMSHYPCAIADEGTALKNPRAKITKLMLDRKRWNPTFRVLLTGTINPNSIEDAIPQMLWVHGEMLGFTNFWDFRAKMFRPHPMGYGWEPNPAHVGKMRGWIIDASSILTRKEVNLGGVKVYQTRHFEMPPSRRRLYNQIQEEFARPKDGGNLDETAWAMVRDTWLRQVISGLPSPPETAWLGKADGLVSLLENDLVGQRVVVWYNFDAERVLLEERLTEAKIKWESAHGGQTKVQRDEAISGFRLNEARVLIIQMQCGRYGLNLSSADASVYYSRSYSFLDRKQSEDRIIDPRKRTDALIIDLVTTDTIDEDIVFALLRKENQWQQLNDAAGFKRTLKRRIAARLAGVGSRSIPRSRTRVGRGGRTITALDRPTA